MVVKELAVCLADKLTKQTEMSSRMSNGLVKGRESFTER